MNMIPTLCTLPFHTHRVTVVPKLLESLRPVSYTHLDVYKRQAPRGCGCNRARDEAAYLDGGTQHPDGHRQHGVAHLGELRAVGVARLFRCRRRGDERRDRRRDEVLRTKENPDICLLYTSRCV